MYLQSSNNNHSDTVLALFLEAVRKYGLSSCVRSDMGNENIGVADFMLIKPSIKRDWTRLNDCWKKRT